MSKPYRTFESSSPRSLTENKSEVIDNNVAETLADGQHPLHNKYTFWYYRRDASAKNYEDCIKRIETFTTIESFWKVYNHLQRPNDIKLTTDYHMFKEGIKPIWEDPANRNGGKCMVRIKKGLTSMYWEELLFAIIGEQFDVGHEICGAVVSIRPGEDIISVWNKTADNVEATNKIRDQIKRILKLPNFVAIEYKRHQECLTDMSSYRNPSQVWKPPARTENPPGHYGGHHYSPRGEGSFNRYSPRYGGNNNNSHETSPRYGDEKKWNRQWNDKEGGNNNANNAGEAGNTEGGQNGKWDKAFTRGNAQVSPRSHWRPRENNGFIYNNPTGSGNETNAMEGSSSPRANEAESSGHEKRNITQLLKHELLKGGN